MRIPVITVSNVSKNFKSWENRPESLKSIMVNFSKGNFQLGNQKEFPCLSDISFKVYPGDFVGIMGRNGAGKSTLMKLISGIYHPSSGSIEVCAPIAPLIELGAGFNGELSGYENIFLNAAILGFGKKASLAALTQILEFSELGDMIHMPVKNYSSGMLVRLGFSIATHLNAPILLVDEVLAVGDAGFQIKCLKKIQELHQNGRTIILITHDSEAVKLHCNRCIILSQNRKIFDGTVNQGVELYQKMFEIP